MEPLIAIRPERIRARMEDLGLNPYSTAAKAGIGQDYVRDILRGRIKRPGADKLYKLAAALECTGSYLMGGSEGRLEIVDPETGEYVTAPPPLRRQQGSADRKAVLLPILHELLAAPVRQAKDAAPGNLGFEAASIPPLYADRDHWFEVIGDKSCAAIAPAGALVQVVAWSDAERDKLFAGDIVVVLKRMYNHDVRFNLVERSLRRIVHRYPDLGLWFFDHLSGDPEWDMTDDVFREEGRPGHPVQGKGIINLAETPEELHALIAAQFPQMANNQVEEMAESMLFMRGQRARVVGKAIRVITPLNPSADFGLERSG
jgi:transcriptional regulator with XRE-family HTH domain